MYNYIYIYIYRRYVQFSPQGDVDSFMKSHFQLDCTKYKFGFVRSQCVYIYIYIYIYISSNIEKCALF